MKTLDRYIVGIFLRNMLAGLTAMTTLFLFQSMFTDIYDHNYPLNQILYYHLLSVPKIIVEMSAPTVLLATVLTLSGMARTQELVACYSLGTGLKRIFGMFLSVVLLVSVLTLVMQDRILPPIYQKRTAYKMREMEKKTDFFFDIRRDKIWYRSKNMIYNLKLFDSESKTIYGMSIYTFDENFNLVQVIGAEKAEFSPNGWKLLKGTVTVFSPDNPFPLTQDFKEKNIVINETPKDFQEIEKEVDGLKLKELYGYIKRVKAAGGDTKAYEVKFHSRFGLSFVPIVMCFLAVPFSLGTRREGGVGKDLGLCLGVTFFYWLFYSIGLSLGASGALPPWLAAWLPSSIFVVLAATLISRKQ